MVTAISVIFVIGIAFWLFGDDIKEFIIDIIKATKE